MLKRKISRSLFLIAVLCCGWLPFLAQAQGTEGKPFKDSFGLVVKFAQGQPMGQLPMLEELGVRWARDAVGWSAMEPKAGQYAEFPAAFKQRLAYYREHKIGLIFILAFSNEKAYPATKDNPLAPIDPKAFGRYAAHVSTMLKKSGVNFVLQVWNEPHNFVIRKMVGGQWNGKPPSPWVNHYVKMVHEVVDQVKAENPDVKIIDCEDVWVAHYWFLEQGLPKGLDGFGIHPYSGASAPGPEMSSVNDKTDWALPFQLVDSDRSFTSAVRRLREHGLKKMGKKPEIWITEWGWALGAKSPEGPITEKLVAAFLPRAFISSASAGVEVLCWFSSHDSVDGTYGLISGDGKHRPAYGAYKTMAAELGEFVLTRQIAGKARTDEGVQAYLFTKGDQQKIALWSADNKPRSFNLNGRWPVTKAVDLMGNEIKLTGLKKLAIGLEPVYLSVGGRGDSINWSTDLVQ